MLLPVLIAFVLLVLNRHGYFVCAEPWISVFNSADTLSKYFQQVFMVDSNIHGPAQTAHYMMGAHYTV